MRMHIDRLKLLLKKRSIGGWILFVLAIGWKWLGHWQNIEWLGKHLLSKAWPKAMLHPDFITVGLFGAALAWFTAVLLWPKGSKGTGAEIGAWKGELTAKKIPASERVLAPMLKAAEWKDMSDRFRKAEQHARADWHRLRDGSESWDIRWDSARECRSLCNLAGTMLAKSPNIFPQLSEKIRLQGDPVTRWLDFLIESKAGRLEGIIHGIGTDEDGKQIGMPYLSGILNDVCSVSSSACISCAAKETEG